MNEKDFASKMKPWLERGAAELGEMQATRLRAARLRAMERYREPVRLLGLIPLPGGTAQVVRYSLLQRALLWLPVAALLAMLAVKSTNPVTENDLGELDAQLLTADLPPEAFLDQDFRSWLGKQQL